MPCIPAGNTVIDRLEFIGDHCPSLTIEAYEMALKALLLTLNTARYLKVAEKLKYVIDCSRCDRADPRLIPRAAQARAGLPLFQEDAEWVSSTNRDAQLKISRLDTELAASQLNHIRESSRVRE